MEIAELYNPDLEPLERLLEGIQRAGDFFVRGTVEVPMPRVEVGVGVLSFPLPGAQVKQIIAGAQRAPYGRGGETILDASVRTVWQVAPEKVRIAGKSWEHSFQQILATVTKGLGCSGIKVSAELYKLLATTRAASSKRIATRRRPTACLARWSSSCRRCIAAGN